MSFTSRHCNRLLVYFLDLKEKIKKLKQKIECLSNKNDSLELEIQGFTRQLNDCRQNKEERHNEIVMLTEQIEKS